MNPSTLPTAANRVSPSATATDMAGKSSVDTGRCGTPDQQSTAILAPEVRDSPPRRLRRLPEVWSDREGNVAYLVTACVEGRARVLANTQTLDRMVEFLLDSPTRYGWFGRRFVLMPDHVHLIAQMGVTGVDLGSWIKAMKAFVGGLVQRLTDSTSQETEGPRLTRARIEWRWQSGFHDHKFRSQESQSRKWEYICLNPVRAGLVDRPEDWPFGGEIFCDPVEGYIWAPRTSALLDRAILIGGEGRPGQR
jgi:REP element-mobilizing transposase RayT